jgi:hypothetical protein
MSFADVLCQACGFSGAPRLFSAGCPVCGHAVDTTQKPVRGNTAPPKFVAAAPPAWAYILALLAFAGIFALLLTK